jgi:Trk-type K+ transport system membrane component
MAIIYRADTSFLEAEDDIPRYWFAIFHTFSSVSAVGMTLTPDNLVRFSTSRAMLLFTAFYVIAGSITFYPLLLFAIIKVSTWIFKTRPLRFINRNPRQIYTHVFDWKPSLILAAILTLVTLSLMIIYVVFDWMNIGESTPQMWLNAYFQAVSSRTSGFNSVDIGALTMPVIVAYIASMFSALLPLTIALRITNPTSVYHEHGEEETQAEDHEPEKAAHAAHEHKRERLQVSTLYQIQRLLARVRN